jgi:hypothetical protein
MSAIYSTSLFFPGFDFFINEIPDQNLFPVRQFSKNMWGHSEIDKAVVCQHRFGIAPLD